MKRETINLTITYMENAVITEVNLNQFSNYNLILSSLKSLAVVLGILSATLLRLG
jgi:hypothetical protein